MYRDFSNSAKQKLLDQVAQVENERKSSIEECFGPKWYVFQSWADVLNIKRYFQNVLMYHQKVFEKNAATKSSVNKLFFYVGRVDKSIRAKLNQKHKQIQTLTELVEELSRIVNPTNGQFNMDDANSFLSTLLKKLDADKKASETFFNDSDEISEGDFHSQLQRIIKVVGKSIKGTGKTTKEGGYSFAGGMVGYINAVYTYVTSEKTGKDFLDLLSKSGKGYVDVYNYIEFLSSEKTKVGLSKKYGRSFAWINAASSGVDVISSAVESANNEGSTAKHISDWTGTASKGSEFAKDTMDAVTYSTKISKAVKQADGTYKYTAVAKTAASSAVKKTTTVLSLADVVLSTVSTGFKSYDKYNEDGTIDLGEAGKIGIESGVVGLSKVVSGLTFGIVNIDEETCANVSSSIETWAEDLGEESGQYGANNPYLLDLYKKGGINKYFACATSLSMVQNEKIGNWLQGLFQR